MEENQQMQQKRKDKQIKLMIIGIAVLVVGLVGVTYAFFNYTRTGAANNITTGRIYFNTEQGDEVTLSNLFPITASGEVTAATPGVGSAVIHITGNTTYEQGIEYLVKSVDVTGMGSTPLPISIAVSYAATGEVNAIGSANDSYFTVRGGNTSYYKILSTDAISEGANLLVGYIAPGQTGIDGELTIMAYLDADNIAITDTVSGEEPASAEYINGTTEDWIQGRTVFSTDEWNALAQNGVSFRIRVEANEGTWVPSSIDD